MLSGALLISQRLAPIHRRPCLLAYPSRHLHASAACYLPRKIHKSLQKQAIHPTEEEFMELLDQNIEEDDTSTLGHYHLEAQRQTLYYLRLIEHEMPKLVAYRKAFEPPDPNHPLIVRSIEYSEKHPAAAKRVIVVPVARLPLRDERAVHKFKLLAGTRWSAEPPRDAGVGIGESDGEHGYVKISAENFPEPAMNLKWASDTFDRLIREANDTTKDSFQDVPLDMRHLDAKVRKAKRGGHARGRGLSRPSLKDFPKEWLPTPEDGPPPLEGARLTCHSTPSDTLPRL